MKTTMVETSPVINFKVGSRKLIDNGLATLVKLLILATVFYVIYQVLILLALGDRYQDLINALQIFESDTTQTTQLKDTFVDFVENAGAAVALSWLLLGLLTLAYNIASMRVYINSVRGKDTSVKAAARVGVERIGVGILFGLYVFVIILGYIVLATMLSALVPVLLVVTLPLSFVLLAMLVVRLLYSYQIISDVDKPKVLSIFKSSKELVKKSGTALFLYILFALALSIVVSMAFGLFANLFSAGPSNNYSLTTDANDIVYNSASFVIYALVGFFISAGWVEIYNQAKDLVENKPSKKKEITS